MAIIATDGSAGGIAFDGALSSHSEYGAFTCQWINVCWLFSFPCGFFYASYLSFFRLFHPGRIKV